ncbi:MAG: DUF3987 domain-containing protein [Pelodictyon phaeoclathratiforme]
MTNTSQEEKLKQARAIEARLYGKLSFPEKSFPDEFFQPVVEYFSLMTDAPKSFLFCSALMTVSAVIGNRAFVQVGSQKLKPNVYLLILAGSTVGRKSTGIQFTRKYLRLLEDRLKSSESGFDMNSFAPLSGDDLVQNGFILPDSGSLEGLIETMREPESVTVTQYEGKNKIQHQEPELKPVKNSGLALYSEFAGFLDMITKEYNKGYQTFIIDCYDGNNHERQLKKERSIIKNPCLSIFGASTMTQFRQRIREDDKHTGYLQRFLFCHETEQQRALQSLIEINTPDEKSEELVLVVLEKVYRMVCVIQATDQSYGISDDAKSVYQSEFEFDQAIVAEVSITDKEFAGVLQGYFGRLDAMRFKIALVFQVVKDTHQYATEHFIGGESMAQACEVIAFFQGSVIRLLRDEFRFTPFEQKTKRIQDILLKNGGQSTRRDLSRSSKWPVSELNEVLDAGFLSGLWSIDDQKTVAGRVSSIIQLCKTTE